MTELSLPHKINTRMPQKQQQYLWCVGVVAAAWLCTFILGKDLNWDFINYHYYAAYALAEGRIGKDYFAASVQSYLNPVGYLPLYWMIQADWHSLLIACVLASFHALNVYLAIQLFRLVAPEPSRNDRTLGFLVAGLAFVAPMQLATLGSPFLDPIASVLVLCGICCFLQWVRAGSEKPVYLVAATGVFLGLAVGMKLTNGVFLLVIGFLLLCVCVQKQRVWLGFKTLLVFTLAGGAGGAALHGYWSYLLWENFGNPVFPLFNALFQSPDFSLSNLQDKRFIRTGLEGLLTLPWDMVKHKAFIYAENVAPDLRVLPLFAVMAAGALVACFRTSRPSAANAADVSRYKLLALLSAFFVLSFFLWGMTSRIGRYAHPLWIVAAPLLLAWLLTFSSMKWARVVGTLVLLIQLVTQALAGTPRWTPATWTPTWLEVEIPKKLKENPHTVLTLGVQSHSVFAPFMHPNSVVVNLVGQYAQPAGGKMTPKLASLLRNQAIPMLVTFKDPSSGSVFNGLLSASTRADVDAILSVYQLQTASPVCEPLRLRFDLVPERILDRLPTRVKPAQGGDRLFACEVKKLDDLAYAGVLARLQRIDQIFDRIEDACGMQLEPRRTQTLRGKNGWMRTYFNSQNTLASNEDTVYVSLFRSAVDTSLGRFADWEPNKPMPECKPFDLPFRWDD